MGGSVCSTENFHSEILGWSFGFDSSPDSSEKASFFLRLIDLDFETQKSVGDSDRTSIKNHTPGHERPAVSKPFWGRNYTRRRFQKRQPNQTKPSDSKPSA